MGAADQPKGAVRRFINLLVGADRPQKEQRYDVRLARALIAEMRGRALAVGSRTYPPTIFRLTLAAADVVQQHLNQSVVKSRYVAYVGGEVAHEMGRMVGEEVPPAAVTVELVPSDALAPGQIEVESWYGALAEGDTAPVSDAPTVTADGIISAFRDALDGNSVSVGGQTIMPRYFAALLTKEDHRFWTQYPALSRALQDAVLAALVERVAEVEHAAKVDREEFVVTYAPDDKVSVGQIDLTASLDPITIGEDGAVSSESPAQSALQSADIVASFLSAMKESTVVVGNDTLVPHYLLGRLSPADHAFWTHYPNIHRQLLAHLGRELAEAIAQKESREVSAADLHVGIVADESVPIATVSVEASLDPLPMPDVPEPVENGEPTELVETEAPAEPASRLEPPAPVQRDLATVVLVHPTPKVSPPLVFLEVSDSERPSEPTVHPITSLPVTVGRVGGVAESGEVYLPLDLEGGLSRRHFVLSRVEGGLTVSVLKGVTNRTRVRGQDVALGEVIPVAPGDELRVATVVIRFRAPEEATPHVTAREMSEAFAGAWNRFAVTIGARKLFPQRIILWLSHDDYEHWTARPDLKKTLEEIAASFESSGQKIPRPLLMPADDLPPDGIRTSASWVIQEGNETEAKPGPPALSFEKMRGEIGRVPAGSTCRVAFAARDYAYWNQSPTVLRALKEELAQSCGLSDPGNIVVESSETLPAGQLSVKLVEARPGASLGPWFSLEVVEPGEATRRYEIERLPAVVGRRGGSPSGDECYAALENVPELSRQHLRFAVNNGVLTVTVLPETQNDTQLDGELFPRGMTKAIEFGQIIAVGQARLAVQPPRAQALPMWRQALSAAAGEVEKPRGDVPLVVRLDETSYRLWTAYAQLERLFLSLIREAVGKSYGGGDPMATRVAEAKAAGTGEEISFEADSTLAEGEARFVWIARKPGKESDVESAPRVAGPATTRGDDEKIISTEAVLAPVGPLSGGLAAHLVVQHPDGRIERLPIRCFPVTFGRATSASAGAEHVTIKDTKGHLAPVVARIEKTETGFSISVVDQLRARLLVSGRPLAVGRAASLSTTDLVQVGTLRIRLEPA